MQLTGPVLQQHLSLVAIVLCSQCDGDLISSQHQPAVNIFLVLSPRDKELSEIRTVDLDPQYPLSIAIVIELVLVVVQCFHLYSVGRLEFPLVMVGLALLHH